MNTEGLLVLGKKAFNKQQKLEVRNSRFEKVAEKFADLLNQSFEKNKSCSVVVWSGSDGVVSDEIVRNESKIVKEKTGLEWFIPSGNKHMVNPLWPEFVVRGNVYVRDDPKPKLSWVRARIVFISGQRWQSKLIIKALKKLVLPKDIWFETGNLDGHRGKHVCLFGDRVLKEADGRVW